MSALQATLAGIAIGLCLALGFAFIQDGGVWQLPVGIGLVVLGIAPAAALHLWDITQSFTRW